MAAFDLSRRASREKLVDRFFAGTGSSYDRVVAVTTFGLDASWKRRLLAHVPADATSILDLACGTGIVTKKLHERAPRARLVGVDITEEYLRVAREKFQGLDADVTFLHSNAETMVLEGEFDAVVSSYIPKYVDADTLLERLEGHVAPGGVLALHDFDYPRGVFPRTVWRLHMGLLRTVGRRVFPAWREAFDDDLAVLIRDSKWTRSYRNALQRHGYVDVARERLSFGTAAIVSGRRPHSGGSSTSMT